MYDLIIRNGLIIDGTGSKGRYLDIAINEDKIVKLANLYDKSAKEVIDAKGKIVAPGFIDIHSHSDWRIFSALDTENVIRQGITTEVVGHCGDSAFPRVSNKADEILEYFQSQGIDEQNLNWSTSSEFFDTVDKNGLPHNIVPLVGHGTIRLNVLGYENRKATQEEMSKMKELTEEALQSGAFGISTGFPYPPGSFAETEEVVELCKIVSKYNGIYATHLRSQSDKLIEAIKEAIEIGDKSGLKVNISHLKASDKDNWGKVKEAFETIDHARQTGLDIISDAYPYIAASNPLSSEFPSWTHEGGLEKFILRLKEPKTREQIKEQMPDEENELWKLIYISDVENNQDLKYIGKSIRQVAEEKDMSSFDTACELLIRNKAIVQVNVICMSEEDVKYVLSNDFVAVGTDGGVFDERGYTGHPRAFGTFPAFIGKYVRDMKVTTLENAIRRVTSLPADFIGIKDRGTISEGNYADIVIFDYDRINDTATYEKPYLYPEGIDYVIVNGKLQITRGNYSKLSCGKLIRKNISN